MALGAIGNMVFANQQTATVASVQNAHDNRIEFQNMAAQALANEKDKKVLEVRPTEDNQEVDPDREHEKNEADQENERNEKEDKTKEDELSEYDVHALDIKV